MFVNNSERTEFFYFIFLVVLCTKISMKKIKTNKKNIGKKIILKIQMIYLRFDY